MSERVGDASTIKMCYAALIKGAAALMTQLQVVAARLGVTEVLEAGSPPAETGLVRACSSSRATTGLALFAST